MRFHVVALPHTQVNENYLTCAYTEKTRKFCNMMTSLGHEVFLYASEHSEVDDRVETFSCISKAEQRESGFDGPQDYLKIDFNAQEPWSTFNERVIEEIGKIIQPQDLICLITGTPAKPIADAFPDNISVEYGIGYSGTFSPYRVFESYAWRHYIYGYQHDDGHYYDEVIPNSYEVEKFPMRQNKGDYYLFVGRLDANKGLNVAMAACERMNKRLLVAGPGNSNLVTYGEYVGVVDTVQRGELMSKAIALFAPTQYVGPFEGVSVEANLCGTPVITTDWGSFTENVQNGVNGYRCRTLAEYCIAMVEVQDLDSKKIQTIARSKFDVNVVKYKYEEYFNRLLGLYGEGWYS